jgi:hypothetical protein
MADVVIDTAKVDPSKSRMALCCWILHYGWLCSAKKNIVLSLKPNRLILQQQVWRSVVSYTAKMTIQWQECHSVVSDTAKVDFAVSRIMSCCSSNHTGWYCRVKNGIVVDTAKVDSAMSRITLSCRWYHSYLPHKLILQCQEWLCFLVFKFLVTNGNWDWEHLKLSEKTGRIS